MNYFLAFRFALRELRGGIRGFKVFLSCIALGVSAISGVNAVALSITGGLANEGKTILGGDVAFTMVQRRLTSAERDFLNFHGALNESATMRTMARTSHSRNLVELKAVDSHWPHLGLITTDPPFLLPRLSTTAGVIVDPLLLSVLDISIGDTLTIGRSDYEVLGTLTAEPDRAGEGFLFAPRVLMSLDSLESSGLNRQGAIIYWTHRLSLPDSSATHLSDFVSLAKSTFPQAGWRVRTRHNAAPTLKRNIDRFSRFLTLVGLATLIVGGVGIANGVRSFLETKRPVIAILKSLGASSRFVFAVYLSQIMILASLGILIGLSVGVSITFLAEFALRDLVPFHSPDIFSPTFFLTSIGFGIFTSLAFTLWPLGQTRHIGARHLFAGRIGVRRLPSFIYIFFTFLSLLFLSALAINQSANQNVALTFLSGLAGSFVLLHFFAIFVKYVSARLALSRFIPLRLAISNLHRPGALTNDIILSLGLGLALIVCLALIDTNLRRQITDELPRDAPDFFFLDIETSELSDFRTEIESVSASADLRTVPMLRGRIISINGILSDDYDVSGGGEWILSEDRGLTYSVDIPQGSTIASGEWWSSDYDGPPLISFAYDEAQELGLSLGDIIEVNVLGRNLQGTITNFRHIEWESLSINFVMIFSPASFAGAPHTHLATLRTSTPAGTILDTLTYSFPTITIVPVNDAVEFVGRLVSQLGLAIRACALLAFLASCLVLSGSLAASVRSRVHDSVILKTLGATRVTLISSYILEYTILGLVGAFFGLLCGVVSAWFMLTVLMESNFTFFFSVSFLTIFLSLSCTIILGLLGTWRVLGYKSSFILREL